MRRVPLLPTLVVAIAVPILIVFGLWQLQRAEWKEALLARLGANTVLPVIDAPADLSSHRDELSFRRVRVTCARWIPRDPTAARSVDGRSGYRQSGLCERNGAEALLVSLGVGMRPDRPPPSPRRQFIGPLVPRGGAPAFLLVSATPAPALAAEAPPTLESIPNNHRSYAVQWFLFALTLSVIYVAYLRQRARN